MKTAEENMFLNCVTNERNDTRRKANGIGAITILRDMMNCTTPSCATKSKELRLLK